MNATQIKMLEDLYPVLRISTVTEIQEIAKRIDEIESDRPSSPKTFNMIECWLDDDELIKQALEDMEFLPTCQK